MEADRNPWMNVSFTAGALAAVGVLAAYCLSLVRRSSGGVLVGVAYNLPIFFVFTVIATDFAIRALRAMQTSLVEFLRSNVVTLAVWAVGAVLLYFRLVEKSIEVSGHMVWLPFLTMQAWLSRFPRWFVAVAVFSTLSALALKLTILGFVSGARGTLVGLVLAAVLYRASPQPEK